MTGWPEALAIAAAAGGLGGAAAVVGIDAGRRGVQWTVAASLAGLSVVLAIAATRWFPQTSLAGPLAPLVAGRREFWLIGPAGVLMLSPLVRRMSTPTARRLVWLLLGVFWLQAMLLPLAMPSLQRDHLRSLRPVAIGGGAILQSTPYTCGPAAAVGGLAALGVSADEGELGVAAFTNRSTGTEPDMLAEAIAKLHGREGVAASVRTYRSAAELPADAVTLLTIRYGALVDHYVAVVGRDGDRLSVIDPAIGRRTYTPGELERAWRGVGVEVRRSATRPDASPVR